MAQRGHGSDVPRRYPLERRGSGDCQRSLGLVPEAKTIENMRKHAKTLECMSGELMRFGNLKNLEMPWYARLQDTARLGFRHIPFASDDLPGCGRLDLEPLQKGKRVTVFRKKLIPIPCCRKMSMKTWCLFFEMMCETSGSIAFRQGLAPKESSYDE